MIKLPWISKVFTHALTQSSVSMMLTACSNIGLAQVVTLNKNELLNYGIILQIVRFFVRFSGTAVFYSLPCKNNQQHHFLFLAVHGPLFCLFNYFRVKCSWFFSIRYFKLCGSLFSSTLLQCQVVPSLPYTRYYEL